MLETVLCVDIGTTSLKAGLISAHGEVVFLCKKYFYDYTNRFVAVKWIHALKSALTSFYRKKISDVKITAISISGNGPTVVSCGGLTLRWNEEFPYNKALTGTSLFLPKILAYRDNFPNEFSRTKYLFSGPEYFIYELTGNAITLLPEQRFAAAYWNDDILKSDGIEIPPEKMPPFLTMGNECGRLTQQSADFLGLEAHIPVFSAGPDFVAALIGTNTLASGKLCDRCGSSEGLNFCIDKFVLSDSLRTLPSSIPDLWNVSFLIPGSSKMKSDKRLALIKTGIEKLKKLAYDNDIDFPEYFTVTGGQAKDKKLLYEKAAAVGMEIHVCNCEDSELLGDAVVAYYGLKKYSSLQDAANNIIKVKKIIK